MIGYKEAYEKSPGGRPDRDTYFMGIARAVAARASCARRKCGAVLVIDGHIISTGYNGAPEGEVHCLEAGCELEHGHCVRSVHAEINALLQAGRDGHSTSGATLYTTASPCRPCMNAIINSRVVRVVYADQYKDPTHAGDKSAWAHEAAVRRGIEMLRLIADDI